MSSRNRTVMKAIHRDYWRLEVTTGAPSGELELLTMAGRRRTTEPFWASLGLPVNEAGRILAAVGRAAVLAEQIADGRNGQAPMFPSHEVMAICRGPYYVIELAETTCGEDKASALITLLQIRGAIRPVIYLMDDEVHNFLADLEEIAAFAPRTAVTQGHDAMLSEPLTNGRGQLG